MLVEGFSRSRHENGFSEKVQLSAKDDHPMSISLFVIEQHEVRLSLSRLTIHLHSPSVVVPVDSDLETLLSIVGPTEWNWHSGRSHRC